MSLGATIEKDLATSKAFNLWWHSTGVELARKDEGSPCMRCHIAMPLPPSTASGAQVGGTPRRLVQRWPPGRKEDGMAARQGKKLKMSSEPRSLPNPTVVHLTVSSFPYPLFHVCTAASAFDPSIRHVVCVSTRHHLMVILSPLQAA